MHSPAIERRTVALFVSTIAAAVLAPVAARLHPVAGIAAALVAFLPAPWLARRLPVELDGRLRRHRVVAVLWALSALLAVLQMGRLSAFLSDARREWGAAVPDPAATHHQCLSAYVYAAELQRRGVENVYDARWYPLFDPPGPVCRLVDTKIAGLAPWASDPYEYPPPFLLLPRAAIALTSSYDAIRAAWFANVALGTLAALVALAGWAGGRPGLRLLLLLPLVLASLPTLIGLQFGQFHAVAVLLAIGGMAAFRDRRDALGGALLGAAIVTKLFPAVLLVVLAFERRGRTLAWTAAAVAAITLAGFVVLGPAPYAAFFHYQVPRLASGAAFAFTHVGRQGVFLLSRNFSPAAVAEKLRLLDAPAALVRLAGLLPLLHTLALLAFAVVVARGRRSRGGDLVAWLALVDLAALRSPVAPAFYVLAPVLWGLALAASGVRGVFGVGAIVLAWAVVNGLPPLPGRTELTAGLLLQAAAIAINVAMILHPEPAPGTASEPGFARSAMAGATAG